MFKIENFEPRLYQETIASTAVNKNTLVVLGTGLGKTKTAVLTAIKRLNSYPNSKILFLTPTKPLADQIKKEFEECTNIKEVTLFTGAVKPKEREKLWKKSKIVVSTPQTINNDIINNRILLEEISFLVIDECHRAVSGYDYVWVAKQYHKKAKYPRILGLTASPGSNLDRIKEICKNLFIDEIEVRTEEDPDVKKYIQETELEWIHIDLTKDFREIQRFLEDCFKSKLEKIRDMGYISQENPSKKEIIQIQAAIHGKLAHGEKDFKLYRSISLLAEVLKAQHALELLETQGVISVHKYMKDMMDSAEKTKVKATKNLVADLNFRSAFVLIEKLKEKGIKHPKIEKLIEIIKKETKNPKIRIMIFNQYRDSAANLEKELNKFTKAKLFVGQTKKGGTGLTQKEQIKILEDFGKSKYQVLISTSIGEEGLDIPKVDLVIFFEPVPSAIRTIQRKGRTARLEHGKVIVLITKNTRDERYHWVAFNKEKQMYKILRDLKSKIKLEKQKKLTTLTEAPTLSIIADTREKSSPIIKHLINNNVKVETKTLAAADYIINENIGVEFKTKEDFVKSIIDRRLLTQVINLKNNFINPLIILQGDEDIYSLRRIHPNSIRGMLTTINLVYGVPIIYTKNPKDTAEFLINLLKKDGDKKSSYLLDKKPTTTRELQETIISSLPGVGSSTAKILLSKYKSIKEIVNAKDLEETEGIGKKRAEEIKRILDETYQD